jgi:exopolyphosphatase/guanosine-5'-triphosphate,3'-diphosphate pyrophosphatase
MTQRIAIIDLGTNTFHLLIAERSGGLPPTVLHREKQPVKIGMGGINRGIITDEALQRALACLKNFRKTMDEWKVGLTRAIGTSALRSAGNGEAVVRTILRETGIEISLISGDQEAEYIYYGVRSALNLGMEKSLIVDIGGGSVECIIADSQKLFWKQSFDVGAQRLLEKFQKHDPIGTDEISALNAFLKQSLDPLFQQVHLHQPHVLVGSSGTFDTLSEICCVRSNIPYNETPETPLTLSAFQEIHAELISCNRAERMKIPGMIEMRVDMIVVASCLIKFLLDRYTFRQVRVSTYSLKEGVLASMP